MEKLSSGYSYVADEEGKNIRSVKQVQEGQLLRIQVTDGVIKAAVAEVMEDV